MNKDMKNNISILTNLYITYNQIKLFIIGDTKKFISIISAFLLVFLIRSSLAIIDTLFIANEFPIQRIIFILSTFTPKSHLASITSSPLFIIVAESIVILEPISQLG